MKIVTYAAAASAANGMITRRSWPILLLFVLCMGLGAGGCADDYYGGAYPGYGPGYYARYPGYGPYAGYGHPGYGYPSYGYPGSITVEVGDRPYYTRGPGYYVGRSYYVWRPGHWVYRNGRRIWVHGHYVLRG
jgi:hypothetical protein